MDGLGSYHWTSYWNGWACGMSWECERNTEGGGKLPDKSAGPGREEESVREPKRRLWIRHKSVPQEDKIPQVQQPVRHWRLRPSLWTSNKRSQSGPGEEWAGSEQGAQTFFNTPGGWKKEKKCFKLPPGIADMWKTGTNIQATTLHMICLI